MEFTGSKGGAIMREGEGVKETPMIFNADMVRAILEGRKTMTRRPVKGDFVVKSGNVYRQSNRLGKYIGDDKVDHGPYGKPGDRLWVRETWQEDPAGEWGICYKASGHTIKCPGRNMPNLHLWRPSIHMPRWASRITLEITDVRVEKINSITVGDVIKEGFKGDMPMVDGFPWYKNIWQSLYPGSWEQNIWVWVISFKVVRV